jgi:antitoxin component YwqK of YwqJK toxin-antitoxin module
LAVDQKDPGLSQKGMKIFLNGKAFSGTLIEHWADGRIFKSSHYKNGRLDGASAKYSLDGRLIERSNFNRGKKHLLQETWFEEGPKKSEQHFNHGFLDGIQTEWRLDGSVFQTERFVAGREVARKILYPNGAIFTNYVKRNNRLYGQDGGKLCLEPDKREGEK